MANTVLVVDDDRELRGLYRLILERGGYMVYESVNGAEALQFLMTYTPDVIIMDMLMPMLGGEAVLQRIRQMPALNGTPVVITTAYPRFREASLHVNQFLVKPVKPEELLQAVASALDPEAVAGE